MAEEETKSEPALPWMRYPVDIDAVSECPLPLLPALDPRLQEVLRKKGIDSLFSVQVAVWYQTIGPGAFERDICVNSATGSGKTLAYALPIVQKLSTRKIRCLRALVVLPTRDLALQVKEVFSDLATAVGLRVGSAVGQSSFEDEISQLIKKPRPEFISPFDPHDRQVRPQIDVDILVATPGRLMDHIEKTEGFSLENLNYLVVDEADRLLREDYQSWLPSVLQLASSNDGVLLSRAWRGLHMLGTLDILRRLNGESNFKGRAPPQLAKMIFSATMTQDPGKLSQLDLHHPLLLNSGGERYKLPEKLKSYKLICESQKSLNLLALLQELKGEKCIVFTSSKESVHRLSTLLKSIEGLDFKLRKYSGSQKQSIRSATCMAFKKGKIHILVTTNALARGMDVEGVQNVISYDKPANIKTYIHRAGRTARAGQTGKCFTLLRKNEVRRFDKMLQKADNNSCSDYCLPPDLLEDLIPRYSSAREKVESLLWEASRKTRSRHKFTRASKRKRRSNDKKQ